MIVSDDLAQIIHHHIWGEDYPRDEADCCADAILRAGYHRPRVIEPGRGQEAALNALPVGTVLREVGMPADDSAVIERFADHSVNDDAFWVETGVDADGDMTSAEVASGNVPWVVLIEPEVVR